jgi:hypothetical protein
MKDKGIFISLKKISTNIYQYEQQQSSSLTINGPGCD